MPRLFLFTDPARTPDPAAAAAALPRGAGVVFRAFGAAEAGVLGAQLARVCRRRGLMLLVGADAGLAARLGADGVHLPERLAGRARGLKRARPRWIVTAAAHSAQAVEAAARAGADAVFVSTVFASASPSAGPPMGALRFAALARRARAPLYALGGVNARTARLLTRSGAAGIAAVEALYLPPKGGGPAKPGGGYESPAQAPGWPRAFGGAGEPPPPLRGPPPPTGED